ncbi:hypothetical protein N7450_011450 [Penicillium hetheringtonii]|uniref:Uncharacterized protein n=1 Tax=Penicillium hetheringtonii TaxID=911720 RepID=A0AAD6DC43_9EURO|nr:hypothetical protein N7450_011450 [Penicillium hetheringtonii]
MSQFTTLCRMKRALSVQVPGTIEGYFSDTTKRCLLVARGSGRGPRRHGLCLNERTIQRQGSVLARERVSTYTGLIVCEGAHNTIAGLIAARENLLTQHSPAVVPAETLDLADVPAETLDFAVVPAETLDLADVPAETLDLAVVPAETLDLADVPAETLDFAVVPAETLGNADVPAKDAPRPCGPGV